MEDSSDISANGANVFKSGFSKNNLDAHFGDGGLHDHSPEYQGYTKDQYAEEALNLIQSATSDVILGHKNLNGQITRYDKENGNFVKGHPEYGIATMFKPKDGEAYYKMILKLENGDDENG